MDIAKLIIGLTDGKEITIKLDDLSNPLKKKLRRETERFLTVRKVIIEPTYNEEIHER